MVKNVYQVVIGCLEKVLKNEICIDYRAIHLLYEHKVGLLERFNYIAVHYKVPEDFKEQLTLYEELIGQCNVMRLKFKAMQELEGIVTDKQKETIQETIIKLKQIAQRENSLLHRLYDAIKGLE